MVITLSRYFLLRYQLKTRPHFNILLLILSFHWVPSQKILQFSFIVRSSSLFQSILIFIQGHSQNLFFIKLHCITKDLIKCLLITFFIFRIYTNWLQVSIELFTWNYCLHQRGKRILLIFTLLIQSLWNIYPLREL